MSYRSVSRSIVRLKSEDLPQSKIGVSSSRALSGKELSWHLAERAWSPITELFPDLKSDQGYRD